MIKDKKINRDQQFAQSDNDNPLDFFDQVKQEANHFEKQRCELVAMIDRVVKQSFPVN